MPVVSGALTLEQQQLISHRIDILPGAIRLSQTCLEKIGGAPGATVKETTSAEASLEAYFLKTNWGMQDRDTAVGHKAGAEKMRRSGFPPQERSIFSLPFRALSAGLNWLVCSTTPGSHGGFSLRF